MPEFLTRLLSSDAFGARGHCYPWKPELVWLQLISDMLIAVAYIWIPFTLVHLVRKRKDIPFKGILLSFAIFMIACAATHGVKVCTLWRPTYWLSGVISVMAAAVSMTTALLLTKLLPAALARPIRIEARHVRGEQCNAESEIGRPASLLEPGANELLAQSKAKNEGDASGIVDGKAVERQLAGSDFRFRPLVESEMPCALTADLGSRILETNTAVLDVLGYGAAEVIRRKLPWSDLFNLQTERVFAYCRSELVRHVPALLIPDRLRRAQAQATPPFAQEVGQTDGGPDASERLPIHAPTKVVGERLASAVNSIEDAIDRKTRENGIVTMVSESSDDERRAEEFRAACNMAEEASAAKSEFLSSMSHELRTPLNAILGFAQLLRADKKDPLSDRHRERIDHILTGGEHLLRLIDDILDLSRIESGRLSVSIEPVNVLEVLEEVTSALSPTATQQGISVRVDLPTKTPMVSADRTRFAQILLNFGSNGVKYNRPAGTVTFVVSTPRPEIVRVLVRDTGIGIPADMQRKIFQPFQRAGQEMGPIQGTGIGLVITRRLALLMGGDVDFRSVAGEGSEFWVDLPMQSSAARCAPPPAAREQDASHNALQMRRLVLYVEDNPANVTFMEDFASTLENVELVSVPTAEVGVDVARRRRPQVVIMDINLPGMSGIEALRALRAVPETKDVPVIALTAAASQRDRERGVQAGFHRYLTKPVKVTELVTILEALLTPSSTERSWSTTEATAAASDHTLS